MELSIAINRYDRHVPFFNGTLTAPKGITLRPLEIGESSPYRDGTDRHARMLNDLEFDIAEMSMSTFIMAVSRDPDLPLVGIPAFPRRFFSAGQIYVNVDSGIEKPADLIGRKVALHSFQTTLSLLGKGDLKLDYDVSWEKIPWVCMREELVPGDLGDDVTVGHGAVLHGCQIAGHALIGMGAVLLDGVEVGEEAIVAAQALVRVGFKVPPGTLVAGVPAMVKRELTQAERNEIRQTARRYAEKANMYRAHLRAAQYRP